MDTNIVEGKWKEFKGLLKENWGNLTEDEIDKTQGNLDQLAGKLQQRYGYKIDEARKAVNGLLEKVNKRV